MRPFGLLALCALLASAAWAGNLAVDPLANSECTAANNPWPCCTGASAGRCDDTDCTGVATPWACCDGVGTGICEKARLPDSYGIKVFTNMCAAWWYDTNCGDTRFDTDGDGTPDQWLVDAGVCTAQQATDQDPLPLTTCTPTQQNENRCPANRAGSTNMPLWTACRDSLPVFLEHGELKRLRNVGREKWYAQDNPPENNEDPPG